MANTESLVHVDNLNAIEVFTGAGIDDILRKIESEVSGFVPNLETAKGRKDVASLAHKVSRSKVVLDNLGKDLVSEWKANAKKVDESRKKSRDYLDNLRDKVRQPLTEWENAEKEKAEAERLEKERQAQLERERVEAEHRAKEEALARREAEIAAKEQAIREKSEAEQRAKEEAARIEKIKAEAEQRAREEAEQRIKKDKEDSERRIIEERMKAERAEREHKEAQERAEREKQEAIQKAKNDAERAEKEREAARIAEEKRLVDIEKARQADVTHRRNINKAALCDIIKAISCDEETGKVIIKAIVSGKISNVTLNY